MSDEGTERDWLRLHDIRPRKRLGQNFLLDGRIPELMIERSALRHASDVLEIGPGAGALTRALLNAGHTVRAIEKDEALVALLTMRFGPEIAAAQLTLRAGDILQSEPEGQAQGVAGRLWIAGNLPYSITTPILEWMLARRDRFHGAVIMVQREYGDRLVAAPGGKTYGSLSVWVQAQAVPKILLRVGRSTFWPRPGVESVVIELLFPEAPPWPGDPRALERVLRAAFGQRRKMLENSLAHGLALAKDDVLGRLLDLGLDPEARAETLTVAQFGLLAERFKTATGPARS